MAILGRFTKQPGETFDYDFIFGDWFSNRTDTPASHQVIVPSGLTLDADYLVGTTIRVRLSGGTNGATYVVQAVMTTSSGVVKEAEFILKIKSVA